MLIEVTKSGGEKLKFDAPVERFNTTRTKSVVAQYRGVSYILYEGGRAVWFAHTADPFHEATWKFAFSRGEEGEKP